MKIELLNYEEYNRVQIRNHSQTFNQSTNFKSKYNLESGYEHIYVKKEIESLIKENGM